MSDRILSKEEIKKLCESHGIEIAQYLKDIDFINFEILSNRLSKKDINKLSSSMHNAEEIVKEKGIIV